MVGPTKTLELFPYHHQTWKLLAPGKGSCNQLLPKCWPTMMPGTSKKQERVKPFTIDTTRPQAMPGNIKSIRIMKQEKVWWLSARFVGFGLVGLVGLVW